MPNLAVKYAGVEFKNPIVAVSGPLGRTFYSLKSSIEAGVGAVTLKSTNAKPKPYTGPKPGSHVYPRPAHTFLRKHGLPKVMVNWEGVPVDFTAEMQAEMIYKIKPIARDHGTKIIANIHPDPMYWEDPEMLKKDIQILMETGPDLFEACLCPYHVPPELSYVNKSLDESFLGIAEQIWVIPKMHSTIPFIAKANFHSFQTGHEFLRKNGVKNFHVTEGPWFYGSVVDIDKMKPLVPGPGVIHYGSLRKPIIHNHVARTVALGDFQVMSSSGVWDAKDAIERMMCGSRLVGIHTAVQYHGHKLFTKIISGISEFLDKKSLNIEDIIGVAQPDIVNQEAHENFMREVDRSPSEIKPVIDEEKCTQCGICGACIHGGIISNEGQPALDLNLCVRCGICESLCPQEAIRLKCL